jgi:hypothetical protein
VIFLNCPLRGVNIWAQKPHPERRLPSGFECIGRHLGINADYWANISKLRGVLREVSLSNGVCIDVACDNFGSRLPIECCAGICRIRRRIHKNSH